MKNELSKKTPTLKVVHYPIGILTSIITLVKQSMSKDHMHIKVLKKRQKCIFSLNI